ncbi:MAG: hypothetical protein SVR81_06375 [Chloroflexota bacterium]|nr:hypothetical protein [Chloroflexota bacterium]
MNDKSWKTKTIITGTVIGAAVGALSSFLLIKRAEAENTKPKLSPGEGVQMGMGVIGLLRIIAGIGSD